MSKKAGIRELKNQTSRIVNEVREEMAEYVITSQGNPVAILRPFGEEDAKSIRRREAEKTLAEMQSLAEENWSEERPWSRRTAPVPGQCPRSRTQATLGKR